MSPLGVKQRRPAAGRSQKCAWKVWRLHGAAAQVQLISGKLLGAVAVWNSMAVTNQSADVLPTVLRQQGVYVSG